MNRKGIIKISVTFFMCMIVFTIISRILNNVLKANVDFTKSLSMELEFITQLEGVVAGDAIIPITTPVEVFVDQILVNKGMVIERNRPILIANMDKLEQQIDERQKEIDKVTLSIEQLKRENEQEQFIWERELQRAQEDLEDIKAEGQANIEKAKKEYEDALNAYQNAQISEEKVAELEVMEELKKNTFEKEQYYHDIIKQVDKERKDKERLVEDKSIALLEKNDIKNLELEKQVVEEQRNQFIELYNNQGKVIAPVDGVLVELNTKIGETIAKDTTYMLLADTSLGYKVEYKLSKEDRDKIDLQNTSAEIEGIGATGETIKMEDIQLFERQGMEETEAGRIEDTTYLTVTLPTDTFVYGSKTKLTIVRTSKKYNTCIPISALRQDKDNQYYILVIDEKNTIMGNELIAVKMNVSIQEQNSEYAAIKEDIDGSTKIIVTSDRAITPGSRIKIHE